jgi:hypothetical protein
MREIRLYAVCQPRYSSIRKMTLLFKARVSNQEFPLSIKVFINYFSSFESTTCIKNVQPV